MWSTRSYTLQPTPTTTCAQKLPLLTVARREATAPRCEHQLISMQSMTFPCTHGDAGVPRLVSGTMSTCREQTQHSRALPPTLPWTRRARCCRRRRDEGMCSSATVYGRTRTASGTRPSFSVLLQSGLEATFLQSPLRIACGVHAMRCRGSAREPSRPLSPFFSEKLSAALANVFLRSAR